MAPFTQFVRGLAAMPVPVAEVALVSDNADLYGTSPTSPPGRPTTREHIGPKAAQHIDPLSRV